MLAGVEQPNHIVRHLPAVIAFDGEVVQMGDRRTGRSSRGVIGDRHAADGYDFNKA